MMSITKKLGVICLFVVLFFLIVLWIVNNESCNIQTRTQAEIKVHDYSETHSLPECVDFCTSLRFKGLTCNSMHDDYNCMNICQGNTWY